MFCRRRVELDEYTDVTSHDATVGGPVNEWSLLEDCRLCHELGELSNVNYFFGVDIRQSRTAFKDSGLLNSFSVLDFSVILLVVRFQFLIHTLNTSYWLTSSVKVAES